MQTREGRSTAPLGMQEERLDGMSIVHVEGELDGSNASRFRDATRSFVRGEPLVIDLSPVDFMDSSGIGALLGALRRAREAGAHPVIVCRPGYLATLLHAVGVDRLAPIRRHLAELSPQAA